jgi:hypothetical protein
MVHVTIFLVIPLVFALCLRVYDQTARKEWK